MALIFATIYDKFVTLFKERVASHSKVGDPFAEDTSQGPQVSKAQYERILSYVDIGKAEGANLIAGGESVDIGTGKGYFLAPTVFTSVKQNMRIYQEEVFGPFVVIATFETEQEAVKQANNTIYGLGASVFTENLERAHRVAHQVESGIVWVNSSQDCDFRIPFGGVKQSGIGRELGQAGLDAYSQVKAVHINMGTKL